MAISLPRPLGEGRCGGTAPPCTPCRFAGDDQPGAPRVWAVSTQATALAANPEDARRAARQQARAALRHALAPLLGCAADDLAVSDARGQPPRLIWTGPHPAPAMGPMGLSISHGPGQSLVAWRMQGPVGVDVQALPRDASADECLRTAALYLGPDEAMALMNQAPDAHFFEAFAQAWAAHEARLKCLGQPLAEWSPAWAAPLAGLQAAAVTVPGCAAALAWPR